MTLNERIQSVSQMDDIEVLQCIKDENPLVCVRAICEATTRKIRSEAAIEAIRGLKADARIFWNQYKVGMFAEAALAILGVEEYRGESREVIRLIVGNLDFVA